MGVTLFTVLEEHYVNNKNNWGDGSHYVTTHGIFSTIDAANEFVLELAIDEYEYFSEDEEHYSWEYRVGHGWDTDVDCGTIILQNTHSFFKIWVERTTFMD